MRSTKDGSWSGIFTAVRKTQNLHEISYSFAKENNDYLRGMIGARNVVKAAYEEDEKKLPWINRSDKDRCKAMITESWSRYDLNFDAHFEKLKDDLLAGGFESATLDRLLGEDVRPVEKLGRLETLAFYREASKLQHQRELDAPRFSVAASNDMVFGVAGAVAVSELLSKVPELQDLGAGPFDYFSHSANLSVGAATAAVAALKLGTDTAEKRGWSLRKTRTIAAMGGMAAATLINVVSETKKGMRLLPFNTTPGNLDLACGIAGGLIGTMLVRVDETNTHKRQQP